MLRLCLFNYSDTYILLSATITFSNTAAAAAEEARNRKNSNC